MTSNTELQVQDKQELQTAGETTVQARYYVPQADIFETDNALSVVLEMPGATKDNISVNLENNQISIEGRIDFSKYENFEPLYTEYNIGHYKRSFSLSRKIDQAKISADLTDGVLTVTLPKAEDVKPRKISIN